MKTAKYKIQGSFNRAAETYDNHCHVQQHTGEKLVKLLKLHHAHARDLLDLGCGTGITTALLAEQYQYENFHALDISKALLVKANERLQTLNIKTHELDFDLLPPEFDAKFDIIFSNMALQWSNDFVSVLHTIHTLLQPDGCLAFTIPLGGTFREIQTHCAMNDLHGRQSILTQLRECGYHIIEQQQEHLTVDFSDTIHALQSIKQIGANHVHTRTHKGLRTRSWFEKINTHALTWVPGYFIARKSR